MYHLIAQNGEFRGQRLRVQGARVTIGSAEECEVRLSGPGVAPRHAQLRAMDGAVTVSSIAADAPMRVNGREEIAHRLRPGDRLTIGPFEFEFQPTSGVAGATPIRAQRRPQPWLAYSLIAAFVLVQIGALIYLHYLNRSTAIQPSISESPPSDEDATPPEPDAAPPPTPGNAAP